MHLASNLHKNIDSHDDSIRGYQKYSPASSQEVAIERDNDHCCQKEGKQSDCTDDECSGKMQVVRVGCLLDNI